MALNWTMLDSKGAPIPLLNEQIITSIQSGAELSLDIPNSPPSGTVAAGGSGGKRSMKERGGIWLTDQRLIFATHSNGFAPLFESLSVPLHSILSTKYEQPLFSGNYLVLEIKPSADGGLTDGTKAEIRLKDQGLFGFVSSLEKTRERAIYMKRQAASEEEEGLPLYTSTTGTSSSSYPGGGVPDDNPPGYDA